MAPMHISIPGWLFDPIGNRVDSQARTITSTFSKGPDEHPITMDDIQAASENMSKVIEEHRKALLKSYTDMQLQIVDAVLGQRMVEPPKMPELCEDSGVFTWKTRMR